MDKKIEAAIRETLVIGNPVSIKRCVDKLKLIFEQEQALRQANVSGSLPLTEADIEAEAELRYPVASPVTPNDSPYLLSNLAFKYGAKWGLSFGGNDR